MTDTPKITEAVERVERWLTWLETAHPFAAASIEAEDLRVLLDAVKAQTEPPAEDVREALAETVWHRFRIEPWVGPMDPRRVAWLSVADSILARFAVSPKKGQD